MPAAGRALAAGREPNRIRQGQVAAQPHRAVRAGGVGVGLGQGAGAGASADECPADSAHAERQCNGTAKVALSDCVASPPVPCSLGPLHDLPLAMQRVGRPETPQPMGGPPLHRKGAAGRARAQNGNRGGSASGHGPLPVRRLGSMLRRVLAMPLSPGCP
jgi:hypothetical protein